MLEKVAQNLENVHDSPSEQLLCDESIQTNKEADAEMNFALQKYATGKIDELQNDLAPLNATCVTSNQSKRRKKRLAGRTDLQSLHDELDETVASLGIIALTGDEADSFSSASNSSAASNQFVLSNMQAVATTTTAMPLGTGHSVATSRSKRSTRSSRSCRSGWPRKRLEEAVYATILEASRTKLSREDDDQSATADSVASTADYILKDLDHLSAVYGRALPTSQTDPFMLFQQFQPLPIIPSGTMASEDSSLKSIEMQQPSMTQSDEHTMLVRSLSDNDPWHHKIDDLDEVEPFANAISFQQENEILQESMASSFEQSTPATSKSMASSFEQSIPATPNETSVDSGVLYSNDTNVQILDEPSSAASSHCRGHADDEVRQTAPMSDLFASNCSRDGLDDDANDNHWITFGEEDDNPFVSTNPSEKSLSAKTNYSYPYIRSSWKSSEMGWKETSMNGQASF
ncbi:hypothetical protein MPSEU_000884700 [Mayamaea pseudoterrestris]|nr:hypothetical protein MPSEU_000884700 [Mayamaea pseudoterrestris]